MNINTVSKYRQILLFCLSIGLLLFSCNNNIEKEDSLSLTIPEVVDFNFHIKPILSDRCFICHGPDENTREGGLRFDTEEGAFAALGDEKDHFAIIANDTANSTLVARIYTSDAAEIMPPPESNLILEEHEKELLKKWIQQGATWKKHWSFIPIEKPEIPVNEIAWGDGEIDAFVQEKLLQNGMEHSEPADKTSLLRRVSFDLTGLPPSEEALKEFLADNSSDAYQKQVDKLLASSSYAEHMTGQWMDLARYADTHGYQDDLERTMWPWRDWVIHAFNENMPYDQFVTWQLAGDLLPNPTKEQLIATAFNRNHKINQEGGAIPEEFRVEYVSDRTQTFGTAFLGLTVECAKCHDHKYDPITQKNFYSLTSFFNSIDEYGIIKKYGETPEPYIKLTAKEIEEQLTFINNTDTIKELSLMVMRETKKPRQAYILSRGAYDKHGEPVPSGTPEAVMEFNEELPQNRLGLSNWLFSDKNPLTARVTVNRLWQQCFGVGIVKTADDFGNQGALPTHPELLDWLAARFMEDGWDVKKMLKTIVTSSTYMQSSKITPAQLEADPENQFLARAPRRRMTAEMIRDHALAASGLIVETLGGPSVKPYQPRGLWAEKAGGGGGSTSKYVEDTGNKLYRRSLYTFWKRTVPPPGMLTFDAATRDLCTVKRQRTSTPLQALVMLNDPQIVEAGRHLATIAIEQYESKEDRINYIFRKCTSRAPNKIELEELSSYYNEEYQRFQQDESAANEFLQVGAYRIDDKLNKVETAAYAMVAGVIFNLDETINI